MPQANGVLGVVKVWSSDPSLHSLEDIPWHFLVLRMPAYETRTSQLGNVYHILHLHIGPGRGKGAHRATLQKEVQVPNTCGAVHRECNEVD